MPEEYKTVTKRSEALLAGQEDADREFKRNVGGLSSEDLVAFANSEDGGTIFLGVMEVNDESSGMQKGKIVGCRVGDRERNAITGKAESCTPPVDLQIIIENTSDKPFFRLEIPSGSKKPYATQGGTYKIRGDGRNKALLPNRLLGMFMAAEGEAFIERFRTATDRLERQLTKMSIEAENAFKRIFQAANNAESLADDAMMNSDEAAHGVRELLDQTAQHERSQHDFHKRLLALLDDLGVDDPVVTDLRRRVWAAVLTTRAAKPDAGPDEVASFVAQMFPQLDIGVVHKIVKDYLDGNGDPQS